MGHTIMVGGGGGGEVRIQSGPIMGPCVQGYKSMSREMCQKQNAFLLTAWLSWYNRVQDLHAIACDAVGLCTGVNHAGVSLSLSTCHSASVFHLFSLLIFFHSFPFFFTFTNNFKCIFSFFFNVKKINKILNIMQLLGYC